MATVIEMPGTAKAPAPAAIDKLIAKYDKARKAHEKVQNRAKAKAAEADKLKAELVDLVERFGSRHTDRSKRLRGLRHFATTTIAVPIVILADKIEIFRKLCSAQNIPGLQSALFTENTTYQLVNSPSEILRKVKMTDEQLGMLTASLGACFEPKPSKPSLAIDVAQPKEAA